MAEGIKAVLRRNLSSAMDKGDLLQAGLILDRLTEEDPLSVETRGMALDYLTRCDRLVEARKLAAQLVLLFPHSPRIQYLAGQLAYREKDYAEAAGRFRESYRLRPHWRSSLYLAKSLTQLGELDEALVLLERLLPEHPQCSRDLAWLYERRGDIGRALGAVEAYLELRPEDDLAQRQRLRLRARRMEPGELVRETNQLLEYGEELAESCIPEYLEALFRTGKSGEARQFLAPRLATLTPRTAAGAGWVCYRLQAYDLAYALFVQAFPLQRSGVKFLAALEFAASRADRTDDLIRLYEQHAAGERHLFGRIQRLRRRASS